MKKKMSKEQKKAYLCEIGWFIAGSIGVVLFFCLVAILMRGCSSMSLF